MSDTDTQNKAPQALSAILTRVADPLVLFSGSLCTLLLLSWLFILPKFTRVTLGDGVVMSPRAVVHYEKKLVADLQAAEDHRLTLVRAVNDPLYISLVAARSAEVSPIELHEQLRQAAARLGEPEGSIVITSLTMDASHIAIEGDVRNVGARSMTVLAAFTDAVDELPFVTDLQRPAFSRETAADGRFHSPFTLSFTLPQS